MTTGTAFVLLVISSVWIFLCDVLQTALSALLPYMLRPKHNIKGQVALVTGGGNGLGRHMALRLAKEGVSTVVIWDVDKKGLEETCKLMNRIPGDCRAIPYVCDVGDADCVNKMAARVKDEVGIVTVLVNNAGIATGCSLLEASQKGIEKVFAVNTLAHFWTVRAFLPDMIAANRGLIMAVSSTAGLHALPRASEYTGSKFAVIGFMESLKMELLEKGNTSVSTTVVCPNFSNTTMFTCEWDGLIALLEPEEVADCAIKALLAGKERVTVPWHYGPMTTLLRLISGLSGQHALGLIYFGKTSETLRVTKPAGEMVISNGHTQ